MIDTSTKLVKSRVRLPGDIIFRLRLHHLVLSSRLLAYGLLGGCTQAPKHMWVHAYLYCVIYCKRWALIRSSDICVPACNCVGSYALTIPLRVLKSPTLRPNTPRVLFHRLQPLGGDSPPQSWARGVDTYIAARHDRLWLTSCSLLPSPCTAETSHLFFHPHNTLAYNHLRHTLTPSTRHVSELD